MNEINEENDLVNHPKHYTSSKAGIEVIEVTRWLTGSLSNAWKYCCRYTMKGTPKQDLEKAVFYLNDYLKYTPEYCFTCDKDYCIEVLIKNMKCFIAVEEVSQIKDVMTAILHLVESQLAGVVNLLKEKELVTAITKLDSYADHLGE